MLNYIDKIICILILYFDYNNNNSLSILYMYDGLYWTECLLTTVYKGFLFYFTLLHFPMSL